MEDIPESKTDLSIKGLQAMLSWRRSLRWLCLATDQRWGESQTSGYGEMLQYNLTYPGEKGMGREKVAVKMFKENGHIKIIALAFSHVPAPENGSNGLLRR